MDVGAWSVSTAASTGLFVALCLTFIPAYARWRARRHAAQMTSLLIVGIAFAGIGTGAAIAGLTGNREIAPEKPRVARSGAVAVSDYVAPLERVGARVVVIASVVALFVFAALGGSDSGGSLYAMAFFAITTPIALGAYGLTFGALGMTVDGAGPATATAGYLVGGVFGVVAPAAALVSIVTRPQRHFARRLWQNPRWHDTADVATDAA
jgi:MFS family permease